MYNDPVKEDEMGIAFNTMERRERHICFRWESQMERDH
jgi:hypothetical protein